MKPKLNKEIMKMIVMKQYSWVQQVAVRLWGKLYGHDEDDDKIERKKRKRKIAVTEEVLFQIYENPVIKITTGKEDGVIWENSEKSENLF